MLDSYRIVNPLSCSTPSPCILSENMHHVNPITSITNSKILGGYRPCKPSITSITKLFFCGGYRQLEIKNVGRLSLNLYNYFENVGRWSMFQFHHVPCSMFKSMFKYDEEMLCFLVQITSFTPNSPRFTHIVNPAAGSQD